MYEIADFWAVDLLAAAQQQASNVCIMYLLLYLLMIVTVLAGGNAAPLTKCVRFACQLAVICNATFPVGGSMGDTHLASTNYCPALVYDPVSDNKKVDAGASALAVFLTL